VHPLKHPRNAALVGLLFVAIAFVYWLAPYLGNGHIDYAGMVMLFALGIAMALMAYVLVAGSSSE
jgi:hypothetical protein